MKQHLTIATAPSAKNLHPQHLLRTISPLYPDDNIPSKPSPRPHNYPPNNIRIRATTSNNEQLRTTSAVETASHHRYSSFGNNPNLPHLPRTLAPLHLDNGIPSKIPVPSPQVPIQQHRINNGQIRKISSAVTAFPHRHGSSAKSSTLR